MAYEFSRFQLRLAPVFWYQILACCTYRQFDASVVVRL